MWKLVPQAKDVLKTLHQEGFCLAVISNTDERLETILRNLNIRQYFQAVITSRNSGWMKPQPEIFELTLEACQKPYLSHQCCHVGNDFYLDYEAARNVGWKSILISSKGSLLSPEIPSQYLCFDISSVPTAIASLHQRT
eukprot:Sdes_comp20079_c0_seq3m13006